MQDAPFDPFEFAKLVAKFVRNGWMLSSEAVEVFAELRKRDEFLLTIWLDANANAIRRENLRIIKAEEKADPVGSAEKLWTAASAGKLSRGAALVYLAQLLDVPMSKEDKRAVRVVRGKLLKLPKLTVPK